MRRVAPAVLVLLAMTLAAAPVRAAVTVGVADLNAWTPNVSAGCTELPIFGFPTNQSTCTYWTTASHMFSADGANIVPKGYGVITRVRVKTANVQQGPMQVVTFRSIRQSNSTGFPGCCWPQYATPAFTPAAGGVTELDTRLPVMNATLLEQYVASGDIGSIPPPGTPPWVGAHDVPAGTQGIENYDALALSVLSATTPIPATDTGDRSNGPAGGVAWPAFTTRTLNTNTGGANGIQVLLQGVWEPDADLDGLGDETQDPDGGHPQAPTRPTPQPQATALTLAATGRLVRRTAQVALKCNLTTSCKGRLRLGRAPRGAAAAAARKTYGSTRFAITGGATRKVSVKLNRAARRELGRRKTLAALATATVGNAVVSAKVTLRRAR